MFEKWKANILFRKLLKRPDIDKAYAMVGPEDSWYDTITTVHRSLVQIREFPHEDLQITSHDGLQLKGVYYPCGSKKTMIWVHGYTSHAERESAFPGLFYRSMGFNVLIPYLRAHGPSQGKYITLGALEHLDIMKWVERINEKIPDGQIVIHGLSMGGGIVLDLADKDMRNVKCLVVDAPSVSVEGFFSGISQNVFKRTWKPVCAHALEWFRKEFGVDAAKFDRIENIAFCKYPMLITAGSNEHMDETLQSMKDRSPMDTDILILPGCNHGNGMYKQTQLYQDAIRALIHRNMRDECRN